MPGLLLDLAAMFVGAKILGVTFRRMGQPAVIGELLAGVCLGPFALGVVGSSGTYVTIQTIGAVVLLFSVGLETPLSELKAFARRSLMVSLSGMVVPFFGGFALMTVWGASTVRASFVGAALVSTSVGVTARVLADLGQVRRVEGRLILGAAVIDDVLGFLVLVVVTQSAGGDLSTTSLRMGAIVGAFLVGLAFAETRARKELDRRLKPVYWLLVPFFFVVTGTRVDLGVFRDPHTVVVGLLILAVAIAGKVIGCGAACRTLGARPAMIVGVGMVPRGEVGIVIAAAGLANGVIGPSLYGIIVALTVATTMIVPPILKALLGYPASAVGTTV